MSPRDWCLPPYARRPRPVIAGNEASDAGILIGRHFTGSVARAEVKLCQVDMVPWIQLIAGRGRSDQGPTSFGDVVIFVQKTK